MVRRVLDMRDVLGVDHVLAGRRVPGVDHVLEVDHALGVNHIHAERRVPVVGHVPGVVPILAVGPAPAETRVFVADLDLVLVTRLVPGTTRFHASGRIFGVECQRLPSSLCLVPPGCEHELLQLCRDCDLHSDRQWLN